MMQSNTITTAQARKRGFVLMRGEYQGNTDDRYGRWYIQRVDSGRLDFRGPGFATRREALEEIERLIDTAEG